MYMIVKFYRITLTCVIIQLKEHTQNCYVGQRMTLLGVGELKLEMTSLVYTFCCTHTCTAVQILAYECT